MPLLAALTLLAVGVLLQLDAAGPVELDATWCVALICVAAGAGMLAVSRPSEAAYTGTLARLAERRGLPVLALRVAVVVTAPLAGLGVAAYAGMSLVRALLAQRAAQPRIDWRRVCGTGLVAVGAVLALTQAGVTVGSEDLLWSVLLAGSGLSLFWWLPERRGAPDPDVDGTILWFAAMGLTGGAVAFVLDNTGLFDQAGSTIAGTAAAIAVLALVVGPRWARTSRALAAERIERARATERAEVGGMLHDSVLQTLALIQDRSDDPTEVVALARRQERELRTWLVDDRLADGPPRSIATALRAAAAEVEDAHRVKIDVVTVGDAPLNGQLEPLLGAVREALVNAAKHAPDSPISLFGEIEERRVAAYVRDRGPGFDLDAIPEDRRGVRDSIFGRMVRHGGHASVRTAPGGGCEVQLVQERGR